MAITLVLAALGVVIALVGVLNDFDLFDGPSAPAVGTSPTSSAPPSPSPSASTAELFDAFSTPTIDLAKWQLTDPTRLVSSPEGALRFDVRPSGRVPEATLTAKPPRDVTSVEFDVTLLSVDGPSRGGVYAILVGEDAQRRIVFGPGDVPGKYGFSLETCPTISCDRGKEYPGDRGLEIGRSYHVRIDAGPNATTFDVGGFPAFTAPAMGPVSEVRLYTSAGSRDGFAVAIDDVRFGYRN